jgi:hypothetical protein
MAMICNSITLAIKTGVWLALEFPPSNFPRTVLPAYQSSIFLVLVPYIVEVLLRTVLIPLAATLTLPNPP